MNRIASLLTAFWITSCVLLAQGDHDHRFGTSRAGARILPLPKEEGVFHFAIYGDRTGGPPEGIEVLRQAVEDTNLLGPDLVMTVGDLVQGYNQKAQWLEQMREYRGVMDGLSVPWFPVAGNHDVYWNGPGRPKFHHEADYEEHFGPLWYWFRHKNAAFVVLYSDEGNRESGAKGFSNPMLQGMSVEQLAWLRATLEATRELDHVFLFMHHPYWLRSSYPGANWKAVHAMLRAAGNVTAVFAGHIHRMHYDGKRDGIEYFALATTGGGLSQDFPEAGFLHHMNLVSVRREGITVATIPVGAVIDPRKFTPDYRKMLARLAGLRPRSAGEGLVVETSGAANGRYELEIENPLERPIEVTLALNSTDERWRFKPDHVHHVLPPGSAKTLALGYFRSAVFDKDFSAPRLELQVELLTEQARIGAPVRNLPVDLALGEVPDEIMAPVENAALALDGEGDCLRIDSAKLRLPDGPFTLEGWLKARNLEGRRAFATKTESSEFGLFVNDGQPIFNLRPKGRNYFDARGPKGHLEPGRWYHIAGVFDGAELRLYVDGHLLVSKPVEVPARRRSAHPFYIGADPDGAGRPVSFFDGWIDELRLSKCARYSGERFTPERYHAPDADTVLLLHLDRQVGPFAIDHSPAAQHPRRLGGAAVESSTR